MADSPRRARGSHFATTSTGTSRQGAHSASNARSPRFSTTTQPGTTGMVSAATPRSRAQRAQAARGGHSSKGPILGAIVALVIVVALAIVVVPRLMPAQIDDKQALTNVGQEVQIVIDEGSDAYSVASTLYSAGIIESQEEFVNQMIKEGADSKLKSGAYAFTVGQDYSSIIAQLIEGPNSTALQVTIPEGYTLNAVASAVESSLGISASEFVATAKSSNYKSEYSFLEGANDDSLEGFLFPKTYNFSGQTNLTADTVIRAMLDQFQTEIATLDLSYVNEQGLSIADMVNLASIVEKESTQSTGAKVAAVFWNRLGNMGDPNYGYLQSDATTAYSVGHDPTAEEVHDENDPYSTYTHQGLPPTPICNPGLEALQNVCSPDQEYISEGYYYFYFWNDSDGVIQYAFSKTYDEHQAAIAAASN